MRNWAIAGLATATLAGSAVGQDVALVAAASTAQLEEIQRVIEDTGFLDSVTFITTTTQTPSADDLAAFDAVMVWTNLTPDDPDGLGDALADYVDAGGGVVVSVFANSSTTTARDLAGRRGGNPE